MDLGSSLTPSFARPKSAGLDRPAAARPKGMQLGKAKKANDFLDAMAKVGALSLLDNEESRNTLLHPVLPMELCGGSQQYALRRQDLHCARSPSPFFCLFFSVTFCTLFLSVLLPGSVKLRFQTFLLLQEGEVIHVDSGPSAAAAAAAPLSSDPVSISVDEKLIVRLNKDGGLENMEVQGTMSLQVVIPTSDSFDFRTQKRLH